MAHFRLSDRLGRGWVFFRPAPLQIHEQAAELSPQWAAGSFLRSFAPGDLRTLAHGLCGLGTTLDRMSDEAVVERLERDLESGWLVVCDPVTAEEAMEAEHALLASVLRPPAGAEPDAAGPGAAREEQRTWFEVRYVDEIQEPIGGLEIELTVDGESQRHSTDGDGIVLLDEVQARSVSARIPEPPSSATPLRDILGPRWDQIREGPWLEQGGGVLVQLLGRHHQPIFLTAEARRTVSIQPRVVRARLLGMFFDTNKCFLLPTATPTIRRLKQLYDRNHPSKLLAVGHTDSSGDPSFNDPLSLERARSLAAYLQEDVEGWLEWYSDAKPWMKRWGYHEDHMMIAAMPDYPKPPEPPPASLVRWYQTTRGIEPVDGDAGPDTRGALMAEYMSFDETTLPPDVELWTHGCGENHPAPAPEGVQPDGQSDQRNRRAELFFFDHVLGVQPPPEGDNSPAGSREYPEWERRAKETYEYHENYVDQRNCHISALLRSNSGRLVLANRPYRLHLDQGMVVEGDTDEDGLVEAQAVPAGDYLVEIAGATVRVPALKPEFARRVQRVLDARPIES